MCKSLALEIVLTSPMLSLIHIYIKVGKDGKDGVDGKIGVNGKDGSSVVINGKDGSIGLNGKDGKDGLTMKAKDGQPGVNGKDGITRIVYEDNSKNTDVYKRQAKFNASSTYLVDCLTVSTCTGCYSYIVTFFNFCSSRVQLVNVYCISTVYARSYVNDCFITSIDTASVSYTHLNK